MARTKRPDGLAPSPAGPPASVDALDDLNLDDMFEDGDDTLFDGLDIDLDGMGEMPAPSNTKKSGATISQDLETMKLDLLGNDPSGSDTTPNRRKTKRKRKIKAPPAPDDDGDEEYELPKKKRKSTKPAAKKTKASTAATKNAKVLATMPPPLQRSTSDGTKSMVAAAGQFGARNQKKQPVVKQYSKTKGSASPSSSAASSQRSSSMVIADPRRLSTGNQLEAPLPLSADPFCGLRPSSTEFFPFMEALPPEPSLKKPHRHFPVVYNIHTSMTTSVPGDSSTPSSVPETDPLLRLMLADLDQQHTDRNSSQAAHNQRRANLGPAILAARAVMNQVDKNQLSNDLRAVCVLLKRQHDFLYQNFENMERWCRDHFTPQDFQSVYGGPMASSSNKRSQPTPVILTAGSMLASLRSPFVKLKVKCSGFKAPKGKAGPLIAQVRLPGAGPLSTKSDSSRPKVKRKASMDTDRTSVSAKSVQEVVVDELQYVDMKPSQRRLAVSEAVTLRAQSLELQVKETQEKRRKALERQRADLQKVVDDDDHLTLNTVTMWKWLEKSPYFAEYLASDARDLLESIWEPEINEADMSARNPSAPPLEKAARISERKNAGPDDSLLLRLQSLLVHEGSDDEGEDDEDDSMLDTWKFGTEHDTHVDKSSTMLDLTELTLEERACIHLKAAGLLDDIRVDYSAQPTLVDEDAFSPPNGAGDAREISTADGTHVKTTERGNGPVGEDSENDIDAVIRSMQTDLVDVRRLNNLRIAFLESAVRSHLESAKESKRREEENATILSKYNQLLKRQKEAKRSGRHKPVKKDGDWVPW